MSGDVTYSDVSKYDVEIDREREVVVRPRQCVCV